MDLVWLQVRPSWGVLLLCISCFVFVCYIVKGLHSWAVHMAVRTDLLFPLIPSLLLLFFLFLLPPLSPRQRMQLSNRVLDQPYTEPRNLGGGGGVRREEDLAEQ